MNGISWLTDSGARGWREDQNMNSHSAYTRHNTRHNSPNTVLIVNPTFYQFELQVFYQLDVKLKHKNTGFFLRKIPQKI